MKTLIASAAFVALLCSASAVVSADWDPEKEKKEMAAVDQTVKAFKADHPKMQVYFEKAYGYVVLPTIGKAAFVFGGSHGKGKVFEQGKLVGDASLSKASIGLQAGAESYSMIVFFADKETMATFKANKFAFDAGASVTAITTGAQAQAVWSKGVAVFTHNKGGLMASASIGGQSFEFTPTEAPKK
jgi:lipid-binding SYLF domain-containing protein